MPRDAEREYAGAPMTRRRISVVAPVYNEAEGIGHFVSTLSRVLAPLPYDTMTLLVDDGSTDGTRERLDAIQRVDPDRIAVLRLSRNFGHQAALTAGMDYAPGDAVITIDADMQHPPELIPELVKRWEEGAEIVQTVRKSTADVGWLKTFAARIFYAIINRFSGTRIEPNAADYRLLSRRVLELFRKDLRERDRFLRGLVSWVGFRVSLVAFDAPPRFAGQPKYSFGKMTNLARAGLISFSRVPLKIAVFLGFALSALSALYGLYAVIAFLFFNRALVAGWASTILVGTFLGGANLLFLGIIGEYIASMFEELKGRPIYIVEAWRAPSGAPPRDSRAGDVSSE
jgi:polyisoprenyl-phosphate glycosyltransferase